MQNIYQYPLSIQAYCYPLVESNQKPRDRSLVNPHNWIRALLQAPSIRKERGRKVF